MAGDDTHFTNSVNGQGTERPSGADVTPCRYLGTPMAVEMETAVDEALCRVAGKVDSIRGEVTDLAGEIDRTKDLARRALGLASHIRTMLPAFDSNGHPATNMHCSCGEWDRVGHDRDVLADLHRLHREAAVQPGLFD